MALRTTEVMERASLGSLARRIPAYSEGTLITAGYQSKSEYLSLYPTPKWDCVTGISYIQIFHSDEPIRLVVDYYVHEFAKLGWSVETMWNEGVYETINPQTSVRVGTLIYSDTFELPQFDQNILSEHETTYTVVIGYFTTNCFDIP